jgi:hypothetical protein
VMSARDLISNCCLLLPSQAVLRCCTQTLSLSKL